MSVALVMVIPKMRGKACQVTHLQENFVFAQFDFL